MKWNELLDIVAKEPVFTSALLMAGNRSRADIQLQLTRWVNSKKIIQLKRGLYILSEPYRRVSPHPFLLANSFKKASYVSLQSALEYYGLIPEYVPAVTSVTTTRPETINTSEGVFIFKHVKKMLFNGYQQVEITHGQKAFIATPEKSLLDLIYLTPHSDSVEYLHELRLQNLSNINIDALSKLAEESGSLKLNRAVKRIIKISEKEVYKEL